VHERWDGGGRPLGLGGGDIPEESRILHAIDALDHMTRPRAYRRNRPLREALAELAFCAGTRLDPSIARTLIDLVEQGKVQVEGAGTLQRLGQPLGRSRGRRSL
jgi:HD-GYP domain-containing protein (c-di-GMP phosphodiesterase class II)